MGRTEYRNVREEWDYEHLDARGNPRRIYVESSFDDSDGKKALVSNKYGIFWKDGHYQRKVVKSTGQGRTVWEDTFEEDVEIRYEWLKFYDIAQILKKGEIIRVPVLSGKKKGSSVDVGYVCFNMKNDSGESVKVRGMILDETFFYYDNNGDRLKGELIIPSKMSGLRVKTIGSFCICEGINRLVLSEGIERIEEKVFVGWKNLREIVFPKTINWIYPGAFEGCNAIKRLVIPEEVRDGGYGLSWYHSFKHVIGILEEIARFEGDTEVEHVLHLNNPFGRSFERIGEMRKKEDDDRRRQEKEEKEPETLEVAENLEASEVTETTEAIETTGLKETEDTPDSEQPPEVKETKDNNNEESLNMVLMKEKWSEWLKKRKKTFIFLIILFVGIPLFLVTFQIAVGRGNEIMVGIALLLICVLFFALINIQMIIKMFNPAEFTVIIEGDTLVIRRNRKEKLSVTSMKTKKIFLVRQLGDIVQIGIYEEGPGFLSSGKGYRVPLAFIPQEQVSNFIRLLQDFYGKDRLLALTSVTSPLG